MPVVRGPCDPGRKDGSVSAGRRRCRTAPSHGSRGPARARRAGADRSSPHAHWTGGGAVIQSFAGPPVSPMAGDQAGHPAHGSAAGARGPGSGSHGGGSAAHAVARARVRSVFGRRAVAAALRVPVPGRQDRGLAAGGHVGGGLPPGWWGSLVSWQGVVASVDASSEGSWCVLHMRRGVDGENSTRVPVTTPGESSRRGSGRAARQAAGIDGTAQPCGTRGGVVAASRIGGQGDPGGSPIIRDWPIPESAIRGSRPVICRALSLTKACGVIPYPSGTLGHERPFWLCVCRDGAGIRP